MFLVFGVVGIAQDEPTIVDPHGKADQCEACHEPPADGKEEPGPILPVIETCRGCHADADMHPIEVAPDEEVTVPKAWPLTDGKLACNTCHGEPAHGGEHKDLEAPYHRGAPYAQPTDFCYECHKRENLENADPHHPGSTRSTKDATCSSCHSGLPKTDAAPADSRLRSELDKVCDTCHDNETHVGVATHMGKKVEGDMRTDLPDSLPLTSDDLITCWTCHEVHNDSPDPEIRQSPVHKGLRKYIVEKNWPEVTDPRWPEEAKPDHPSMLSLPIDTGALCRACHGDGP